MKNYIDSNNISQFELTNYEYSFDYFTWAIVLISCLLIIISKFSNSNIINQLIKNSFTSKQDNSKSKGMHNILLNINFVLIISLFTNRLFQINNLKSDALTFLYWCIGIFMILGIKMIIIYFIDTIFKRQDHFHIFHHLNFYKLSGIILLPLYVFTYFVPEHFKSIALTICISFIIIFIILREIKSFFNALSHRISLLYIILYLCTLEILPLILAFAILKG
jgi:hypothetical protein